MAMSEKDPAKLELTFNDIIEALHDSVPAIDEGKEVEGLEWNAPIPSLDLLPEAAEQAGLGEKVRCQVVGNAQSGVALILRPRSIFDHRRYGYFIQHEVEGQVSVWHGPARKPERGQQIGGGLLEEEKVRKASSALASSVLWSVVNYASKHSLN